LRESIGKVVGSIFYGELLRMSRASEKGPYGHGGRGEEVFLGQLHGLLAERLGERSQPGLADAIYHRFAGQQERLSSNQTRDDGESW